MFLIPAAKNARRPGKLEEIGKFAKLEELLEQDSRKTHGELSKTLKVTQQAQNQGNWQGILGDGK